MKRAATFHFLSWVALALLLPGQALAQATLTCNGPVPVGNLFDTVNSCTGITGMQNVFSGLMCQYETVLNDVLRQIYCSVSHSVKAPLTALMALYVAIMGVQIGLGYVSFTAGDLIPRLVKMLLVWMFAAYAVYGISITYNFFMAVMDTGVSWALSTLMPTEMVTDPNNQFCAASILPPFNTARQAFQYMDFLVCKSITNIFTDLGMKIAGFFAALTFLLPPVFFMFTFFSFRTLFILVRSLLAFLLATGALTFLISGMPFFVSCALYKPTYKMFDDWLRHIISFVIQVILIFVCLAMWLIILNALGSFFITLAGFIFPVQDTGQLGAGLSSRSTWGICMADWRANPKQAGNIICDGVVNQLVAPSALNEHPDFIYIIMRQLTALCAAAYFFDALIKMIPSLAKYLAGPGTLLGIGGGGGASGTIFGGVSQALSAGQNAIGTLAGKMFKSAENFPVGEQNAQNTVMGVMARIRDGMGIRK